MCRHFHILGGNKKIFFDYKDHPWKKTWLQVSWFLMEGKILYSEQKQTFEVPIKWHLHLVYSKILKSMILWLVIFRFGLETSAHEFFLQLQSWPIRVKMWHSVRGQIMEISTFDIIKCVKRYSHHGIWEEQAKEWEVFRYQRACFSELQNTIYMYTERTVLLILPKD